MKKKAEEKVSALHRKTFLSAEWHGPTRPKHKRRTGENPRKTLSLCDVEFWTAYDVFFARAYAGLFPFFWFPLYFSVGQNTKFRCSTQTRTFRQKAARATPFGPDTGDIAPRTAQTPFPKDHYNIPLSPNFQRGGPLNVF